MKTNNIRVFIFFFALLLIGVATVYWGKFGTAPLPSQDDKPVVFASFYPYVYLTERVGGEHITVKSVIPAGVEPHDYEPSPRDIQALSNSMLVVMNGVMDSWIEEAIPQEQHVNLAERLTLLPSIHHESEEEHEDEHSDEEHDHGDYDPHYWLDPVRMIEATNIIRDALVERDTQHQDAYIKNAEDLVVELQNIDNAYREGLQSCSIDTVVVSHNAFSYLAERYGFTSMAIAGISPHDEPSAQELAGIVEHIREYDVPTIFSEPLASAKYAETLSKETGKTIDVLDPIESLDDEQRAKGVTYSTVMRDNLAKLRMAMNCQ